MPSTNRLGARHPQRREPSAERIRRSLELIGLVRDASDPSDLVPLLCSACAVLGGDAAGYFHQVPEPGTPGRLQALLACEPAVAYDLTERGTEPIDRWLKYARDHAEPFVVDGSEEASKLESDAAETMRSVLLIPTHSGGGLGRFGVLVLASRLDGYFDRTDSHTERMLAQTLAMQLHAWWTRETRRQLLAATRLRPLEVRLLELARQGMGSKDSAAATGMTTSSIDSHFQRIFWKMGLKSRQAASLRAAIHGLI